MLIRTSGLLIVSLLLVSCGGGSFTIDNYTFEPKIVIQGILLEGQPANDIKIMRNFPIGATVNDDQIIIRNAVASITDDSGVKFDLQFNSESERYEYGGPDLRIAGGRSYTLAVRASIDGKELSAQSTTTVPQDGFEIVESKSVLGSMFYRQRDENGDLIPFEITFNRSPGTDFYALVVDALDADVATFIYDNAFGDFSEEDVLDDFQDFKTVYSWVQDTPKVAGESAIQILSFFTWFYGDYEAVVYAGDRNFKDFLITHEEVKEIDGNFHEPAFHIEGDGIGLFGSAIRESARFTVLRP